MNKKKLIVNADDFGQSQGINKGIVKAFEKGILTSASLMVRYPDCLYAAEYSKKNNLGLGIHIDLGEWMYSNGNWISVYEVISLDDLKAVTEEINKQLETFYHITGKNPTHMDSHQHVHQREFIKPVFLEFAKKLNITLRGCTQKVNYCGDFNGQSLNSSPLHDSISIINLKKIISTLPNGITELACHPGIDVEIQTMYKIERAMEVNSLCDESIKEEIAKGEIELCSFSEITF